MHKFGDNKNYVTFSLSFLRIPPCFKSFVPSINPIKDTSPWSWAWNEVGGKRAMGNSQNICKVTSH
jgi:hypothetical protein